MGWLDQLQPASFRGVPFQVDDINHQAGDTVVVREYPFQDLPTVFRMGEGAEEIRFAAYVIGEDYIEQRDALRDVLTGEGVLVHPTAGSLRVYVAGRYGIKENPTYEGGVARFDLTFIRAEPRRYPVNAESTEGEAEEAADDAAEAAQADFAADFALDGVAGWVADRAGSQLLDSIGAAWAQIGPAVMSLDSVAGVVGEFASGLIGGYQSLVSGFDSLLALPAELAASVAGLFALPVELTQAQAVRLHAAYQPLFVVSNLVRRNDFDVSVLPPVGTGLAMFGSGDASVLGAASPARSRLAQLTGAADRLIETLAVSAYVRVLVRTELTSYDQAMAARAAVHAQCTRLLLMASAAPAPRELPALSWHDAVATLHTAALRDLQARSRNLVRLTTYTPTAWQPVWFISYRLYGTADYADEILAMNPHIDHPLLVPPGQPLRVVRRDA